MPSKKKWTKKEFEEAKIRLLRDARIVDVWEGNRKKLDVLQRQQLVTAREIQIIDEQMRQIRKLLHDDST